MQVKIRQVWLLLAAVLLVGCEIYPTPGSDPLLTATPVGNSSSQTGIQVFFTAPGLPAAAEVIETALLSSIDGAQEQIEVAMYNFSLASIADGLVAAAQRGVTVRLVVDSDALDGRAVAHMQAGGVKVVGDGRESLMHNKFLVIDGGEVWSGSLNLTESGLNNDNNNFVRIKSEPLARLYQDEFNEMFELGRFGAGAPIPAGAGQVVVGGITIDVLFSPDDRPAGELVSLVKEASTSVDFLAYAFTLNDLRDAMLQAQSRGVRVRGVFDEDQSSGAGGEFETMKKGGAAVRLDGVNGLMHDKVIILDGETVVLGSYNFTRSANENNDENLLIIHDAGIARQYLAEFERIFAQAK